MPERYSVPLKADPEAAERRRWEPTHSIRLNDESDEFQVTSVVAVKPTWRDLWKILRGTYRPMVVRRHAFTAAGYARAIKKTWTSEKMHEQFYQSNPMLDMLRDRKRDDA